MKKLVSKVAILSYDGASFFELGCAIELFSLSREGVDNWYQTDVITFDDKKLLNTVGVKLVVTNSQSLVEYDTLIIPSWPVQKTIGEINPQLVASIVQFKEAGKRIFSFCSGAFLLAELGFLNNRQATTHWKYATLFKQRYPTVDYVEDVLYVYEATLGTSAGSAAALDLGIEIIRQDYGYQVANKVARQLVLSAHRSGGQSQFVQTPILKTPGVFTCALDWAIDHLAEPINIDTFAAKANMSRRSFDRKFKSSFNLTPNAWLVMQRLNLAKSLLESKSSSVDHIAQLSGFSNAITMRHHFRKLLGVSPNTYRNQFKATDVV